MAYSYRKAYSMQVVHTINIGGMEPLISFDLSMDILEYAKQRGCIIGNDYQRNYPVKGRSVITVKRC